MKVKKNQWIFFKLYSPGFIYKQTNGMGDSKSLSSCISKLLKLHKTQKTISIMPISNIKLFFFHDIHVSTFSSTFVSVEFPSYQ